VGWFEASFCKTPLAMVQCLLRGESALKKRGQRAMPACLHLQRAGRRHQIDLCGQCSYISTLRHTGGT